MARQLGQTSFEKGMEQGKRDAVRRVLEAWFGPLSKTARDRFESLSSAEVMNVGLALLEAKSLADLGLEDAPD